MSRLLAIKHSPTAITYTQLSSPKTAGNPYFFDKAGTLFKVGETVPYLGREFIPEQEESWLIPTSQFRYEREYTLEELKNIYYMVDPINKEQTMFRIWNGKEGYYNVIDRFCNEYFKRKLVDSILFSFDNFILVNKTAVYSDRRRHRLRGDGQPGLLRGERHPDLLCQTRPPIADCKREKLCEIGTCEGESHNNGRVFRNAEGALPQCGRSRRGRRRRRSSTSSSESTLPTRCDWRSGCWRDSRQKRPDRVPRTVKKRSPLVRTPDQLCVKVQKSDGCQQKTGGY